MAHSPLIYSKSGCEWATPSACPTWDNMINLLELHTAEQHGANPGVDRLPSTSKLEILQRQSFSLDKTEAEWSFKESQCVVYNSQATVTEPVKVQQLKAA